jgi:RecA-family ATPase
MAQRTLQHPVGREGAAEFLKRTDWVFKPQPVSKFDALFLDQLDDAGPEHAWLVHDWLSIGDRSVIAGASRSGKSFFAIHIGLSVALGLPMMGYKTEPGLCIYQAGEGVRGVKKRLRAFRLHHEVAFSRETPFVLLQRSIDIYRDVENVDALIEEILNIAKLYECPLRLVVIDTLATASVGADEISGRDMGVVLNNVARINARTGAHVLLVHHLSKA